MMQRERKLGRSQWAGKCQGQLSSFRHPIAGFPCKPNIKWKKK